MTRGRATAAALLVLSAGCSDGGAVPDRVACRDCVIRMEPVLTIGDSVGSSMLNGRPTGIIPVAGGRYLVSVLDAVPMLHDPATGGRAPFARQGGGPGEFRYPQVVAPLPGDSILIRDMPFFHVLAPDLTVARSLTGPLDLQVLRVARWPDTAIAVSSGRDPRARTTWTVVALYDLSGETVAAHDTLLTTPPNDGRGAESANGFRLIGDARTDDGTWISDYNSYRLVRYTWSGEPRDLIVRRPGWIPGGEPMRIGGLEQRTTPHLIDHWIDDAGRMWVLAAELPSVRTYGNIWKA